MNARSFFFLSSHTWRNLIAALIMLGLLFGPLLACAGNAPENTASNAAENASSAPDGGSDNEPESASFEAEAGTETEAENGGSETSAPDAGPAADNGFRPELDGFSFENYGEDGKNLTPALMWRMFGDEVCVGKPKDRCRLTPTAREWMEQTNESMNGGHCEGMAVLSTLMYYGQVSPSDFGAESTSELDFDRAGLQREIAYWFATQYTSPGSSIVVNESPQAVVETLIETFQHGLDSEDYWVMGIYQPDFSGGHAITPFAVEDLGDGMYNILVYDNNWPGETRYVEVDTNANTWQYQAAINPDAEEDLYQGDASTQTLEVVRVMPRTETQECEFCDDSASWGNKARGVSQPVPFAQGSAYYEIWLQGAADLLIQDQDGRRIGFVDGRFVNEIPQAQARPIKLGIDVSGSEYEPVYRVPVGTDFDITIDGSRLVEATTSTVAMIGPGYFMSIEDIVLDPGQQDTINVHVDGGRQQLTYYTSYSDSPEIMLGMETPDADYAFLVQALDLPGEQDTFLVAVDLETGDFILNTSDNTDSSTYAVYVLRMDETGDHVFGTEELALDPGNTVYLNYLEWAEEGSVMYADFDYENDGQLDESLALPDQGGDEFYAEPLEE